MFTLPQLPYAYNALEPYIDEQTMTLHHTKHHQTYVDKLNEALKGRDDLLIKSIEDLLRSFNSLPDNLKNPLKNHGGGHSNHSLFWAIMAPKSEKQPEGKLLDALNSTFSDFSKFKEAFTKAAAGRFGSGWAWLIVSNSKLEIIDTPNQDSPLMENKTPILGLDVWEHAYYLKYQNRRPEYVEAWWNVVNWSEVEKNFNKAFQQS